MNLCLTPCLWNLYLVFILWQAFDLYSFQVVAFYVLGLHAWGYLRVGQQEVFDVAKLAGLTYSVILSYESSFIVEFNCFLNSWEKATENHKTNNCSASSAFPMITMKTNDTISTIILLEKQKRIKCNFEKYIESWSLMIFPYILEYFLIKYLIVILSITDIYYQIVSLVLFIQVLFYLVDWITICLL